MRGLAEFFLIMLGWDLFLLALFPSIRLVVDPLLLFLVFLGSALRSSRFLWLFGLGLGLLKDFYSPELFGAWAGTFSLTAWLIGASRTLVQWEDPPVVGVWTAILTLLVGVLHGIWLILADPFLHWGSGRYSLLPAGMLIQGMLATWAFPRFQRLMAGKVARAL